MLEESPRELSIYTMDRRELRHFLTVLFIILFVFGKTPLKHGMLGILFRKQNSGLVKTVDSGVEFSRLSLWLCYWVAWHKLSNISLPQFSHV